MQNCFTKGLYVNLNGRNTTWHTSNSMRQAMNKIKIELIYDEYNGWLAIVSEEYINDEYNCSDTRVLYRGDFHETAPKALQAIYDNPSADIKQYLGLIFGK